jgi:Ca2+-binding RTX toxin-like protein
VNVDLNSRCPQRVLPGKNTLAIQGTIENVVGSPFADLIRGNSADNRIWGGAGNDTIYGGCGHDLLYGGAGNDRLFGDAGNDVLMGEGDNDVLNGGAGDNVLVGGDGDDTLVAGFGKNVLIGGLGSDNLRGSYSEDILIGGTTDYDVNDAALRAILAEWTARRPFSTRINNLTNGGGLNGSFVLKRNVTVRDDAVRDVLFGGAGSDWFLDFATDSVSDRGRNDR